MSTPDSQNTSESTGLWSKIKTARISMAQLLVLGIAFWLFLTWVASSQDM